MKFEQPVIEILKLNTESIMNSGTPDWEEEEEVST